MRVLFDVSCLDHERISGVGTYARHLGYALSQNLAIQITGSWRITRRRRLDIIRRHWTEGLRPYVPLLSDWSCREYQVFHGPDYRVPSVWGVAKVVTVHDLAFFEEGYSSSHFSRTRQRAVNYLMTKQNPDAVIAVSEFTREQILKRFPQMEGRVHTIWHGADHLLVPANRGARPLAEPYYLFVGNLESRKNVAGLIKAFAILKSQPAHRETRLILVGKAGFGFEEILSSCREVACSDHIILPGFLSNMNLVNYYQWAEGFVYPSLYEGFGFPILEAMRLGCPVVTSNLSATREVADGAALLVDPANCEEIADAMARVAEDQNLREDLIQRGRARGQQFNWQKCADQTIQVYQQAIEWREQHRGRKN